ncbi:hypothetical protein LTR36_002710 [Oleoguttula mirabilis]|uniref:Uncharacterized protein n=1 Tax=Oleoguttula mirabilis TaxID=1507867 RepID=A0AAV9JMN4_9PEZI|nr:hypothetical protein LTR36_002710 [Oleoguttula mirabilis]
MPTGRPPASADGAFNVFVFEQPSHQPSPAREPRTQLSRRVPEWPSAPDPDFDQPPRAPAGPNSWSPPGAPRPNANREGGHDTAAGTKPQPRQQSFVEHQYNVAVESKAQILHELREVCDNTMAEGGLDEAKEKLEAERAHVDAELESLKQENEELRREHKMQPRGRAEKQVEKLTRENRKLTAKLAKEARVAEIYDARMTPVRQHNINMHKVLRDIESKGYPTEANCQVMAEQLQEALEAREAAEDRLAAIEREVDGLREEDEELHLRAVEPAESTGSKRPEPQGESGGDEEALPPRKKAKAVPRIPPRQSSPT